MAEKKWAQGMLTAVDIPWSADYSLDEESFRRLIGRLQAVGSDILYVMGTAGEGYAVNGDRYRRIVDVFVDEMAGCSLRKQVGVISLSTVEVIERIGYAHDRGVRSFQISLPSWGVVTDSEMMGFFRTVCGAYPDASFLHYNLSRAGRILTGDDYRGIIDAVPNLVAAKLSTYDMGLIRGWMLRAPELQHFFLQQCFAYGCVYGECSLLCSMHGLFPQLTREYFAAGRSRDLDRLFAIQLKFAQHREGVVGHISRPMIDGGFDKLLVWLTDQSFPRRLLPPYEGVTDEEAEVALVYYLKHQDDVG